MATALKTGLHSVLTLILALFFLWGGLALCYRLPFGGALSAVAVLAWALLAITVIGGEWTARPGRTRLLALLFFMAMALWWATIRPSLNRDWRPELAHTVQGEIRGSHAFLHNIRSFSWKTPDIGSPRWLDAAYDLDTITGVDMYLSYWMGPWIAHSLIGFRFADGRQLVFSAEIRRAKGQRFSTVSGFFKQFELAMIAAMPEDIIRLRTDIRRENVFRYPLKISPEKARRLFEIYIDTANGLAKNPKFYNTLTTNCTTVIFDMIHIIDRDMHMDWRMLLSGKLPSYLYERGKIDTFAPLRDVVKRAYITGGRTVPSDLLP